MKIAVMGSGGVGGYYGGRLAAAGGEVSFIARGAHLAAMRRNGLRIISPLGDVHIAKPTATDQPGLLVKPGDHGSSLLWIGMARRDSLGMPPVGSTVVDEEGLALVAEWIDGMER